MKQGYVYVIQFDDQAIKVGRSENPTSRIDRHRVESAKYGRYVTAFWSSGECDATQVEHALKVWCTDFGSVRAGTREYFTDLVFSQCVTEAEQLTNVGWSESQSQREILDLKAQIQDLRRMIKDRPMVPCSRRHPVLKPRQIKPYSDPADRVLVALESVHKISALMNATEMSRPTLYKYLKILMNQGRVYSSVRGRWFLVTQTTNDDPLGQSRI